MAEVERRAEVDGNRFAVPAPAVRRLDVAGADQADGHDRRAAAQRQPGNPGPELVQPAVGGAGALGEDPQRPALAEDADTHVDHRRGRAHIAPFDRHLAQAVEERRHRPPAKPACGEVLGLGEEEHLPAAGDRDEELVRERLMVGREDERAVGRDVLGTHDLRPEDGPQCRRQGQLHGPVQHVRNLPPLRYRLGSGHFGAGDIDRTGGHGRQRTPARRLVWEIRHTGVVKIQPGTATSALSAVDRPADRTRDLVARTILETGPQNAADLAGRLGLSPAGIRRHLDALVADGLLLEREPRPAAHRGRGRPARSYALTDAGRAAFPHAYDDLASTALRYLRETGGEDAVRAFAEHRAATLAADLRGGIRADAPLATRVERLADGLSASGYASTTQAVGTGDAAVHGIQICQHHCPVAHVAAEFPELCEAETRAFAAVLGTYVQRLATIAHGDGVCTTHVPTPPGRK